MKLKDLLEASTSTSKSFDTKVGPLEISIDFSDPEEREASIWGKVDSIEDLNNLIKKHHSKLDRLFGKFDVSLQDGTPVENEKVDGGIRMHIEFPPDDDDHDDYFDDE